MTTDNEPIDVTQRATVNSPAPKQKVTMKLVLFVLGGALSGYLYYRFVGCRSGACPITSSPIVSSLYGAMMGFLLSRS